MARTSVRRTASRTTPRSNRVKPVRGSTRRDPDGTKGSILSSATQVFAEKGFSGASIKDIVDECGFNKRMIYHYFGDKEGLYRAVILQQWIELKDWFDDAVKVSFNENSVAPITTPILLREAIRIASRFMAERRRFVRLMMWDGLEGGVVSNSIWKEARGPLFVQVDFFLQQAKDEGLLPDALDTGHLVVSFLGAISFYFAYAPTLKEMIGKDPLSEETLREREEHMILLLESLYLRKAEARS